jgi:DNA end-binding protein Ku
LPKRPKVAASKVTQFTKAIDDLTRKELDMSELEDQEAEALKELVDAKQKDGDDVIHPSGLEEEDAEAAGGAQIIDLMAVLRKSLAKNAVVTTANSGPPISLAERRAQRDAQTAQASAPKKKASTRRKTKAKAKSKAPRKRARRG